MKCRNVGGKYLHFMTPPRSRSAFRCVRGMKWQCTVFIHGWDRYRFDKKCTETRYTENAFLYPVGSVGHVVHSCASGARHGDILFLMLG
jgi:hypothetical protein